MKKVLFENRSLVVKYAVLFVGVLAANRLSNDVSQSFWQATLPTAAKSAK